VSMHEMVKTKSIAEEKPPMTASMEIPRLNQIHVLPQLKDPLITPLSCSLEILAQKVGWSPTNMHVC